MKKIKSLVKKYKATYRKHKVLTVVLTVLLSGLLIYGGFVLVEFLQFRNAEKKIRASNNYIVSVLGEPYLNNLSGNCHYASAKYTKGDLWCSYYQTVFYEISDKSQGAQLVKKVANNSRFIIKGNGSVSDPYALELRAFGTECYNGVSINSGNELNSGDEYSNNVFSSENLYLGFYINCGKSPSLIRHYPVE